LALAWFGEVEFTGAGLTAVNSGILPPLAATAAPHCSIDVPGLAWGTFPLLAFSVCAHSSGVGSVAGRGGRQHLLSPPPAAISSNLFCASPALVSIP
jgi:hypothetical protein